MEWMCLPFVKSAWGICLHRRL